jgi:serine/threonine protein kinase
VINISRFPGSEGTPLVDREQPRTSNNPRNPHPTPTPQKAPETLDLGRISRPSDVYAFGILLYELYTGESAFKGVAKAMLGYEVVRLNRRPGGRMGGQRLGDWSLIWGGVMDRGSWALLVKEEERDCRRVRGYQDRGGVGGRSCGEGLESSAGRGGMPIA